MRTPKTLFSVIIALSVMVTAFSQPAAGDPSYLFPEFEEGVITFTTGGSSAGRFNYSIVDGTVLMLQDDQVKILASQGEIGTVRIGDRMFIRADMSDFYEKVKVAENRHLYIKWLGQLKYKGKQAAYGQTSHTSSTNQYSIADGRRLTQAKEEYEVIQKNVYYLNINGKYRPFSSAKTLAKIFKEHKDEIAAYASSEKTDFKNVDDVVKLLEHFGGTLNYR